MHTMLCQERSLTAYVESQKAVVESAGCAGSPPRLKPILQHVLTESSPDLSQRQADLTAYAEDQRRRPSIIAQEESRRADTELEAAACEAEGVGEAEASRYPGAEDPKPDQRAAARDVARESAARHSRQEASYCRRSAIQGRRFFRSVPRIR